MDDRMGAKIGNSLRKRARRRSHTRKIPIDGFINMAQVRREIVSALQLHRSCSSTSSSTPSSSTSANNVINMNKTTTTPPLVMSCESINPVPEPIWSTTAPAVLAVPPAAGDQIIDYFQWPENLSSSYTWWSSFLNSLDGKITSTKISNYSYVDNIMLENSKCPDGTSANLEAPVLVDANDQNPFPDEWLIVPTADQEDSSELL